MPRKKKVVNDEPNLAPLEQDLTINEVKSENKESDKIPTTELSMPKKEKKRPTKKKNPQKSKELNDINQPLIQQQELTPEKKIEVEPVTEAKVDTKQPVQTNLNQQKVERTQPVHKNANQNKNDRNQIIHKNVQQKKVENTQTDQNDVIQPKTENAQPVHNNANQNNRNQNIHKNVQQKKVESTQNEQNEVIQTKAENTQPVHNNANQNNRNQNIHKNVQQSKVENTQTDQNEVIQPKTENAQPVQKVESQPKVQSAKAILIDDIPDIGENIPLEVKVNTTPEVEVVKKPNKKKKKNKKKNVTDNKQIESNTETSTQAPTKQVEKKVEAPKVLRKVEPEIVITINPKKMLTKEQEKNPFLINFFQQVENFLRKEVQIEQGQKLLVAMSGGVDSSVLFDALSVLSMKMKFIIYVLHFNHKLRGLSSERDEKLVNQLSKDYNVQYFNASGNVKQFAERNSLSIEYAARQLRYNFFEKVARTMNANFVATAHTADDNAETFFLNLFRGSGLTGLSGIPAKRNLVKNVMMLRPLITFRKKDLLEYAKIRRLKWFEDETNSLLNYTRNKIRLSLIPRLEEEFNPSITDIINQTTRLMSGADRLIRDIVKKNYPLVVEEASQEKFTIKLPMLMANEEFIQGEILQYLWLKYFRLQPLPMQTINRILSLNNSISGSICEINSLYFVLKDRNNLIFTKRQYEENIKLLVSVPGKYFIGRYKIEFTEVDRSEVVFDENPNIEYFDRSIMESFLEIRNWQMGDTFQPLGMKGDMKVSDFLINEKVPITEKASVIVLTNKIDIIWMVGKRISDKFKIKKNAEKVIKAVIIKNEKK